MQKVIQVCYDCLCCCSKPMRVASTGKILMRITATGPGNIGRQRQVQACLVIMANDGYSHTMIPVQAKVSLLAIFKFLQPILKKDQKVLF